MNLDEIRKTLDEIFGEFALKLSNFNCKNFVNKIDVLTELKNLSHLYFSKVVSIFEQISQEERAKIFADEFIPRADLAIPINFPYLLVIFIQPKEDANIRFGWIERVDKLHAVKGNVIIAINDPEEFNMNKVDKIEFLTLTRTKN